MMVEVSLGESSFVLSLRDEMVESYSLPAKTTVKVWKHELYFSAPIKFVWGERETLALPGNLYYWPIGESLCIFLGLSEPYSPVVCVGEYVGRLHDLRSVEDGVEAEVRTYQQEEELAQLVNAFVERGFSAATARKQGEIFVAAHKVVRGYRIGVCAWLEQGFVYAESEPFFRYTNDFLSTSVVQRLKAHVGKRYRLARLDLTEDEWVFLSFTCSQQEIGEGLEELLRAYQEISGWLLRERLSTLFQQL